MTFPPADRVIYGINPLTEVVCQLRFPTILRLNTEVPADFQERIRQAYPQYTEKRGGDLGQLLPQQLSGSMPTSFPLLLGPTTHEFATEDGIWTITLNRDALALTTRRYTRWEEFRERLVTIFDAFVSVYNPPYLLRVGLRYQDVIIRSHLNLSDASWLELLQPHIAGVLSSPEIEKQVTETGSQSVIRLADDYGSVRIQYGLGQVPETGEVCFIIDSDFFKEKTETNHAADVLDRFNRQAGWLFRWCITDRLHDAMCPEPV